MGKSRSKQRVRQDMNLRQGGNLKTTVTKISTSKRTSSLLLGFTPILLAIVWKNYTTKEYLDSRDKLIKWLRDGHGAYVNPSVKLHIFEKEGTGVKATAQIVENEILWEIPQELTWSVETIQKRYPQWSEWIQSNNDLMHQDAVIASALIVDCALGQASAYLNALPSQIVPRLDTFTDDELLQLQDQDLMDHARQALKHLNHQWENEVKPLFVENFIVTQLLQSKKRKSTRLNHECFTFESFHKYCTIASSRSLILNHTKHLTPMADMVNYAPHQTNVNHNFSDFHALQPCSHRPGTCIVGRADRTTLPFQQVYEDYGGSLDNSVYLEQFGFVPFNNPHHCALLRFSQQHPQICLKADGSLTTKNAQTFVSMLALEKLSSEDVKRQECMKILQHQSSCPHLDTQPILVEAAKFTLEAFPTTLQHDLELLHNNRHHNTPQWRLALEFRIQEKALLNNFILHVDKEAIMKDNVHATIYHD